MPYIKQDQRDRLDRYIDNLASELQSSGLENNLQYVVFKIAKKLCKRYKDYAHFEGDVNQSLREIYRRCDLKPNTFIFGINPKYDMKRFNWIIDNLVSELEGMGITGNLNYIVFRLSKKIIKNHLDLYIFENELQQSLLDIYSKLESKYEDKKILENGDIE